MKNPITIVGSGLAGYTVARELRKLDKTVDLRLITADDGSFYSKPQLSNGLAAGKEARQIAGADAVAMARQLDAEILSGTRVSAIDRATRRLGTERGPLPYGKLVLALGADPIRLPLAGDGADLVLSVNNLADYERFRQRLRSGRRIVLLGAGLIGCEFANDLAGAGYEVHVFDIAPRPLARLLPPRVAVCLRLALEKAGVRWHLGHGVAAVERDGARLRIVADDGEALPVDLVLSAVGLRPHTALAAAAGLTVGRGVVVDSFLRTSDDHIYALGDCAEVGGQVLPYVQPIMHGARALAASLVGAARAVDYPPMPVTVKTPACPVVICPPPPRAAGDWHESPTSAGVRALFLDREQKLQGFALAGDAAAEKQTLASRLGSEHASAPLTA